MLPSAPPLVLPRYVGRTFIMPDQRMREMSVRRKLNAMPAVFEGRNVLLIDDSIVRGTTMAQIVDMVRRAGAKKVRGAPRRGATRWWGGPCTRWWGGPCTRCCCGEAMRRQGWRWYVAVLV